MNVRGFQPADAAILQLLAGDGVLPSWTGHNQLNLDPENGRFWVIEDESAAVVGYAAIAPVPGLPGLAELDGAILPPKRRRGYGRFLLRHVVQELAHSPFRQLSHRLAYPTSPAGHFLRANGFFVEHEEWVMQKTPPSPGREQAAIDDWLLTIGHLPTAVATLLTLYDQSFAPHPWYQPYTASEVQAILAHPDDILFLQPPIPTLQSPIGFAWLHLNGPVGEIEPIGIVPAWQGKGYGRFLLKAALHKLSQRGADTAQITAWDSNTNAIRLYRSLGFHRTHTHTYLAYNLREA